MSKREDMVADIEEAAKILKEEGDRVTCTLFMPHRDLAVLIEKVLSNSNVRIQHVAVKGMTVGASTTHKNVTAHGLNVYEFEIKDRYSGYYRAKNPSVDNLKWVLAESEPFDLDLWVADMTLTVGKYKELAFSCKRPVGIESPIAEAVTARGVLKRGAIYVLDLKNNHNLYQLKEIRKLLNFYPCIRLCSLYPRSKTEAICRIVR